jgi:hypothetical protein
LFLSGCVSSIRCLSQPRRYVLTVNRIIDLFVVIFLKSVKQTVHLVTHEMQRPSKWESIGGELRGWTRRLLNPTIAYDPKPVHSRLMLRTCEIFTCYYWSSLWTSDQRFSSPVFNVNTQPCLVPSYPRFHCHSNSMNHQVPRCVIPIAKLLRPSVYRHLRKFPVVKDFAWSKKPSFIFMQVNSYEVHSQSNCGKL